jgi:hypothetical protein
MSCVPKNKDRRQVISNYQRRTNDIEKQKYMIQKIEDKYREYAINNNPFKYVDKKPPGRNKGISCDPKFSIEMKNSYKYDKQSVPIYNSRANRKPCNNTKTAISKQTEFSNYGRELSSIDDIEESSIGQVEVLNSGRRKAKSKFNQMKIKESNFNYKRPLKSNALLPDDLHHNNIHIHKNYKNETLKKRIPGQEILVADEEMNRFDHDYLKFKPSKIYENISPKNHNSDIEEDKANFEEESKRFNNDYFEMFAQDHQKEEQSNDDLEEDYEPDFEEIQEEIVGNDNQEEDRYSESFSQASPNKKRTSTLVGCHKFPKEFIENPYLYYAKKAQKKMKQMSSLKNQPNKK